MLILLHGFTGDPSSWDAVRAHLGDRSILCPTLLGHGAEASDSNVRTFEAEVDRLAALAEERGFRGAHLCGYSLGARVALGMLVRHPRLFSRATLIGVNAGIERDEERAERARSDERWAHMLEERGIEAFTAAWEAQPLFATQSEELRAKERTRRLAKDPRELARSLRVLGLAAMPSYWASLSKITIPLHLFVGAEDRKFAAIAERMHPMLPNGRLTIVPGVGHNVPLEDPSRLAALLSEP